MTVSIVNNEEINNKEETETETAGSDLIRGIDTGKDPAGMTRMIKLIGMIPVVDKGKDKLFDPGHNKSDNALHKEMIDLLPRGDLEASRIAMIRDAMTSEEITTYLMHSNF